MRSKNNIKYQYWTPYIFISLLLTALVITVLFVHRQQQLQTKATFDQKDLLEISDEYGTPLTPQEANIYQLNSNTVRIRVK